MKPKKAIVEKIATIMPIATRNIPFTISLTIPQRTVAKSGSLMSGLQGKMAGVQISGGGVTGTSQKVVIRCPCTRI